MRSRITFGFLGGSAGRVLVAGGKRAWQFLPGDLAEPLTGLFALG